MKKGIYLRDAGIAGVVLLVIAILSIVHASKGGDNPNGTITVRPAEEQKR